MGALVEGQILLDRYVLIRPLGRGGTGEVWLARDTRDQHEYALKIFPDADARHVERLEAESARAGLLQHPAIVRVHGFHRDGDCAFMVMEAIDGEPLDSFSGDETFDACQPGLVNLAAALQSAHKAGLVHRDVKVHNVLRDRRGRYRLTDFGQSAYHDEKRPPGGGSLYSVSPQQLDGKPASPADDVYAFGVLIYELLTGKPPFYPDISGDVIRQAPPPKLDVGPTELGKLVRQMLEKDASKRPSMSDVRAALEALAPPAVAIAPARFESIAPISRQAPAASAERTIFRPERRRTVPASVAAAALAALLVLAGVVFFGLPRLVAPPNVPEVAVGQETKPDGSGIVATPAKTKSATEEPGLAPFELAELTERRRAAQDKFDAFFEKKRELERQGVEQWGADEYAAALESARTGDELFRTREYEAAGVAYAEASEKLSAIVDSVDNRFDSAIKNAWQAYEDGDGQKAVDFFDVALSIDADSSDATRGKKRAEVLGQVLAGLETARLHEQNGRPSDAIAAYRGVLKIDGAYTQAQKSIDRINAGIVDARFRKAMSEGLAAIARGDRAAAEKAFRRAQSIRPNSAQAADGLTQVRESTRSDNISSLRAEAIAHENAEAWSEASAAYAAILKLDDTLDFARDGERRALQMADMLRQMNAVIEDPASLRPQAKFEDASALLTRARGIENKGTRLREATIALARVLRDARIPVRVMLESDNETEVVVYHVDRLGRFATRELDLWPGRYTAVGTRPGYRDVRQEFIVLAGKPPPAVVVRCEERI